VPASSATFALDHPLDLRLTLSRLAQGRSDPSLRIQADGVWRASRTPDGPVTLRLRTARPGGPSGPSIPVTF